MWFLSSSLQDQTLFQSLFKLEIIRDHFLANLANLFSHISVPFCQTRGQAWGKAPVRIPSSSLTEVWSAQTWTLGTLFTHIIVTCEPPCRKHKIHLYILNLQAMTAQTEQGEKNNRKKEEKEERNVGLKQVRTVKGKSVRTIFSQLTHPNFCVTKWKCEIMSLKKDTRPYFVSVLVLLTAQGQISFLLVLDELKGRDGQKERRLKGVGWGWGHEKQQ